VQSFQVKVQQSSGYGVVARRGSWLGIRLIRRLTSGQLLTDTSSQSDRNRRRSNSSSDSRRDSSPIFTFTATTQDLQRLRS